MRAAHSSEIRYGMEYYSTDTPGIGGRLKERFEDFVVEEITSDRKILALEERNIPYTSDEKCEFILDGKRLKFVNFVVQKYNLGTMDVANIIASSLKISRHFVTYAGLKDKRAITTQMMSVPSGASKSLSLIQHSKISIRDPQYTRHPIHIGDLWGNRFTILLKNIETDYDTALRTLDVLEKQPILNYFGVQRFGVTRPNSHLIGKAAIKRDFETALRIMLVTTSEYESENLTSARQILADELHPTDDILKQFPESMRYEKSVMTYLMKHPGDYKKAFSRVPPRIQTFLVHAYQSYLFNRIISHRFINGLSMKYPEVGDFLIQLNVTHSGRDSWLYVTERNLDERIALVDSGEYGLAAPILGYATKMPHSKQSIIFENIMKDEDIQLIDFHNPLCFLHEILPHPTL